MDFLAREADSHPSPKHRCDVWGGPAASPSAPARGLTLLTLVVVQRNTCFSGALPSDCEQAGRWGAGSEPTWQVCSVPIRSLTLQSRKYT